ncbi:hypothetical protein SAMN04487928_10985 [Butyrivibrio proteoclasticus]|uniref:Uncharacterized protein n=1 Tax=Butyrivibrio proteoclasticus TaxID=43305 RepID=A0A1I5TMP5_9FIRM|nr:hypothetical protein SAMN04487928_10985 [Butyrivibrio proteoclasticus]
MFNALLLFIIPILILFMLFKGFSYLKIALVLMNIMLILAAIHLVISTKTGDKGRNM